MSPFLPALIDALSPPFVALILLVLLVLAAFSAWTVARIERRYPPTGRFVDANGARLHVVERGSQAEPVPTIVLHGASGNLYDQLRAPYARRLGHTLFVDRPGHGYSTRGGPENDSPEGQADTILALMDALRIERAVVMGHSYAGAVAAALALNHPTRVAGLVLLSPVTHPWPGGNTLWYYDLGAVPVIGPVFARTLLVPFGLRRMACAVRGVFAPQPVPSNYEERAATALALRPRNFLANAADLTSLYPVVERLAPRWHEISAPTIVIAGEDDRIVWTDIHARAFARAVPHARLVTVPGLGHKPDYWTADLLADAIVGVRGDPARFEPSIPRPPAIGTEQVGDDARGIETGPDTPATAR